jgi:hypothetical protein
VLLDLNLPVGDASYLSESIGTEYWYQNTVAVRAGYKNKKSVGLSGLTGLTAGVDSHIILPKFS